MSRDHVNQLYCNGTEACSGAKIYLADSPKLGKKSCLKPGESYGGADIYCGGVDACKDMDMTMGGRCAGLMTRVRDPKTYGTPTKQAIAGLKCHPCHSTNGCPQQRLMNNATITLK